MQLIFARDTKHLRVVLHSKRKMAKFIGGFSVAAAVKTAQRIHRNSGWHAIIDYAREGSCTMDQVSAYQQVMSKLFENMKSSADPSAIALKPSTFAPAGAKAPAIMHCIIRNFCRVGGGARRVFIDAESPADRAFELRTVAGLMERLRADDECIKAGVVLYTTVQAYRRDALLDTCRIMESADFAARGYGLSTGIKLVRGAYHSRMQADSLYQQIEETHTSYNTCLRHVLQNMQHAPKLQLCVATHNKMSVELTLSLLKEHRINKKNMQFAQLLGIGDKLSAATTGADFITFKYVPFGKINEMTPYLVRRLVENYQILSHIC